MTTENTQLDSNNLMPDDMERLVINEAAHLLFEQIVLPKTEIESCENGDLFISIAE